MGGWEFSFSLSMLSGWPCCSVSDLRADRARYSLPSGWASVWFPFSCVSACTRGGVHLGSPSFRCKFCSHVPVYALRDCAFPRGLHRLLPGGGGSTVWLHGLASGGGGGRCSRSGAGACAPGDDGAHLPRVLVRPSACSVPGSEVLGFSERVPVRH